MSTYGSVMGIDLGTTYSCVSILQDGSAVVCNNEMGENTTPSMVAYDGSRILVGKEAKNQMSINPGNTIFDAKRLIGRKMGDDCVCTDMDHWPFEVVPDNKECNDDDELYAEAKPKIRITSTDLYGNQEVQEICPEEVSAQILMKMAQFASREAGKEIKKAVITVPAYFNNEQRLATKRAGELAGLEVIGIINEPTAAALAYGIKYTSQKEVSLVFDLGGGTFDVSILYADKSKFEVLGTLGDTHLGGADFDQVIVDMCIDDLIKKELIEDSDSISKTQLAILRNYAEIAKRDLSSNGKKATLEIPNFIDGKEYQKNIRTPQFNSECDDSFQRCIKITKKCLQGARRPGQDPKEKPLGLTPDDIKHVIFVGGSTRIPKVREMVQKMFPNSDVCTALNPDEAVAQGAALYAASLVGEKINGYIEHVEIKETTPINLGIKLSGGNMGVVLPRGYRTGVAESKKFYTKEENQKVVHVMIYEGDEEKCEDNNKIGEFNVDLPEKCPSGSTILVTFCTNECGILDVTALVEMNKQQVTCQINPEKRVKNDAEIEMMKERVKKTKEMQEINSIKNEIRDIIVLITNILEDANADKIEELTPIKNKLNDQLKKEKPNINMDELNMLRTKIQN